jgi:exosortase
MNLSVDLKTQRGLLKASAVVGALAYWRLLFWNPAGRILSVDAWLFAPSDPLPQAIFLIAAAIVYRRRETVFKAMQDSGSAALAVLPLLAGSALFLWAHYVDAMDLLLASFLLVGIGAGLLWFGTRLVWALAIPCAVLAFTISTPVTLANQVLYPIRLWTASQTAALLRWVGYPVFRHGNMIYGDDVIAQVIDSCSGLRSMEMLMLAAVIYVGWYPVRRARGVLLIVSAPLLAYAFNIVRVGVIAIFPTSEFSRSHSMQGMAVFLGAVVGLVMVDRLLARLFPSRKEVRPAPSPPQAAAEGVDESQESADELPSSADRAPGLSAVALAGLLVMLLGASIWAPQWSPPEDGRRKGPLVPAEVDGWIQEERLSFDRVYFWSATYSRSDYRRYERDDEELSVFIGYDHRENRGRSLISPKNALPGRGREIVERGSVAIEGMQVQRVVAQSISGITLNYHWYEETEPLAREVVREVLALDQSRFRRSQPARVIRVTTDLGPDPLGWSRDEEELRAFATSLAIALRQ